MNLTNGIGGYRILNIGADPSQVLTGRNDIWQYASTFDYNVPIIVYGVNDGNPYCICGFLKSKTATKIEIEIPGMYTIAIQSSGTVIVGNEYHVELWQKNVSKLQNYTYTVPLIPRPTAADNGKVLEIVNGNYALVSAGGGAGEPAE